MFRLSSPGNGVFFVQESKRAKERTKKGGREKEQKNERDSDYVADAPQEFVVCVFRYEPCTRARARAFAYRAAATGIVIYERSFVEFADDILPRGARLLTGCGSQLQCRILHLRRFRHLLRRR